ncbi:cytochrome c biogenesis heme-transporting ATPase CcmA [Aliiglaciecola litoralis]|uniref:Cytochrome c biogenesis heme-transporting ATPase CcmA n=1 Tax=Aliiglaciecola litoralis TaxID=582857 RepID=A0ABP3WUF9_9ALTE
MALLSGHNLSCVKQDRLLFDNLDFSVAASELLYIRGQNGAGKTSLLRIIVGLTDATTGQVDYQGQNIRTVNDQFHQELVYIGHKPGLNHTLSAIENLSFWCQLHNLPHCEHELMDILALLGLVGLEDIPVRQLSAGQQRRAALARLWLKSDAKIWVLDEPFTALDVQGIELLRQRVIGHLGQGGAVIITSHQQLDIDYKTSELMLEYRI